ncbi:putative GrpE nucleotide exchange factor [Tanacetum coccineum]
MLKIVTEKEELVKAKQEEIANMKEKVLGTYVEMENIMPMIKREVDESNKFAIQSFAKRFVVIKLILKLVLHVECTVPL